MLVPLGKVWVDVDPVDGPDLGGVQVGKYFHASELRAALEKAGIVGTAQDMVVQVTGRGRDRMRADAVTKLVAAAAKTPLLQALHVVLELVGAKAGRMDPDPHLPSLALALPPKGSTLGAVWTASVARVLGDLVPTGRHLVIDVDARGTGVLVYFDHEPEATRLPLEELRGDLRQWWQRLAMLACSGLPLPEITPYPDPKLLQNRVRIRGERGDWSALFMALL
jgi:hypothetical protein